MLYFSQMGNETLFRGQIWETGWSLKFEREKKKFRGSEGRGLSQPKACRFILHRWENWGLLATVRSNFQKSCVLSAGAAQCTVRPCWEVIRAQSRGEDLKENTGVCFLAWSQVRLSDAAVRDGWLIVLCPVLQELYGAPATLWFCVT